MESTLTMTLCECSENHVGMEKNGNISKIGFNKDIIDKLVDKYNDKESERIDLTKYLKNSEYSGYAELLIIRKAIENHETIYNELIKLDWDKKYYCTRRKKVLNKLARSNLCFDKYSQDPDYENKKGRIVCYENIPNFNKEKNKICNILNEDLKCEGNKYDNTFKQGIGWHGDSERLKVIGFRFGKPMTLCFNWFNNCNPIGEMFKTTINSGDIYIMSEKVVGNDWKKKSLFTLRHSAGGEKYTNLDKKETKSKLILEDLILRIDTLEKQMALLDK